MEDHLNFIGIELPDGQVIKGQDLCDCIFVEVVEGVIKSRLRISDGLTNADNAETYLRRFLPNMEVEQDYNGRTVIYPNFDDDEED